MWRFIFHFKWNDSIRYVSGAWRMPQTPRDSRTRTQLQWSTFQCSPAKVFSVKEDINTYFNVNCFLVRVSCISDIICQFVHRLSIPLKLKGGRRGRDRMVVGFTTTCAISAYYQVVRSNPVHGEVYSIQYYAIQFVRDLRFLPFSLPINLIVTI